MDPAASDPGSPTAGGVARRPALAPPETGTATPRATLPAAPGSVLDRRPLWLLLGIVLAFQLWTWSRMSGYQLADSIEYLERAEAVVAGQPLDPGTLRSFAFSALLMPIFWIERWLDLDLPSLPILLARVMQILLGLTGLLLIARQAARRHGPAAGLAAGLVLGINPIFPLWSVEPLSASAGMLAVAIALVLLDGARDAGQARWGRGLQIGATLGVAVLMAYQNLLVSGLIGLSLPLLRCWRKRAFLAGAALGFGTLLLLQCFIDAWSYGAFGSSLVTYFKSNFGPQLGTLLYKLGFQDSAKDLFQWAFDTVAQDGEMRTATSRDWYLRQLFVQGLPVASALLLALGALLALVRRNWFGWVLLAVLLVNVGVMSTKGSKSFRLWMPLLPPIALLAAQGAGALWPAGRQGSTRWRPALGAVFVVGLCWQSAEQLLGQNLGKFGSYWRAIAAAEPGTPAQPRRIASAYNWAVRYQNPAGTRVIKLPHHLDRWPNLGVAERNEILRSLDELDGFVGHLQSLSQDPELMALVNRRFQVAGIYHDYESSEDLEPIYRLELRRGRERERTFFDVFTDTGPGAAHEPGRVQAALQHPGSVDFRRIATDGVLQMVLLGYEAEPGFLDGTQAWVTYWWYAGPLGGHDYQIIDRFTDTTGGAFQNNHRPGYGAWPTPLWTPGSIVKESYLTRIPPAARAFGGDYRRGDVMPIKLWMAIAEFDAQNSVIGGLNPFRPSAKGPSSRQPWRPGETLEGVAISVQGRFWSKDALSQVGGFWMPVAPSWRLPDDGRPLPPARP